MYNGTAILEKGQILKKLNMHLPYDLSSPKYLSKRTENVCPYSFKRKT